SLATGYLRLSGPAFDEEPQLAMRGPGECGSVMRIDCDRLLEQPLRRDHPLFCYGKERRERAQVEIIGGGVACRSCRRAAYLSCLQRRLDDAGDAQSNLVLKL